MTLALAPTPPGNALDRAVEPSAESDAAHAAHVTLDEAVEPAAEGDTFDHLEWAVEPDAEATLSSTQHSSSALPPSLTKTPAHSTGVVSYGPRLHVGSQQPHATDGESGAPEPSGWARLGSLRQLEPELGSVLEDEPLPATNLCISTSPESPPPRAESVPGPFTDEELLPPGIFEWVVAFGEKAISAFERAGRGKNGWEAAKRLRPTARTFTEAEALNPCGWGFRWHKESDGLWHALQPSSIEDPPDTGVNYANFAELAERHGLTDLQMLSWMGSGLPGAPKMPAFASLAPPHVGALKHVAIFAELAERDEKAGYVTTGHKFPDYWPCTVDPLNCVMQKGKGRLTIDKTMHISGDPELPSYNLSIDLAVDEEGKRYVLVRIWQFARAIAILERAVCEASDVEVVVCKFDLEAFFRKNGKQRFHLWQGGRLTPHGFGTDKRCNFGERDAPDHTGRISNALAFFIRKELRRLEREYPSRHPRVMAWLAHRFGLRSAAEVKQRLEGDDEFLFDVLFFIMFYVDDAGLAIIDDLLFDSHGEPVIIIFTQPDGTIVRQQQRRGSLYFEAAIGCVEYVGFKAPLKKRVYPCRNMVLIGFGLELDKGLRFLEDDKATAYLEHARQVADESPALANGALRVAFKTIDSLVHRLIHASEVLPNGRVHLFHLLKALRAVNRLAGNEVILGEGAQRELRWWIAALQRPQEFAPPMASRFSFPSGLDDGLLVDYGDASREFDEASGRADPSSGLGAWCIIERVFCYVEDRWSDDECRAYSINVLEMATMLVGGACFLRHAKRIGIPITHIHTFVDNTTAECVSERGRTSTEGLNALKARRDEMLKQHGAYMLASRVASEFNDVADLLSRGDIAGALRFAEEAGLPTLRLDIYELAPEQRDLSRIPPTWA